MEFSLIKDEGGLDLHPNKTVICPKTKYRETLLNVKSKNFKTKDGKKNRTICQKTLNKLTNKTPLVEPEAPPSTIKTISPEEDLDTGSLDDHSSELERLPESSETVLNVKSNNFQTEDGKNGTICQKTLNTLTNKTPLLEPEAPPSTIKTISPEEDLDTESLDDDCSELELPPESDSEYSNKKKQKNPFFWPREKLRKIGSFAQFLGHTDNLGLPEFYICPSELFMD